MQIERLLVSKKELKTIGIPYSPQHIARLEKAKQFPSGSRLVNAGSPGAIRKSVSGSPNGSPDAMQPSWLTITPDKGALRGLPVQPSVPFFRSVVAHDATERAILQVHFRPIGAMNGIGTYVSSDVFTHGFRIRVTAVFTNH